MHTALNTPAQPLTTLHTLYDPLELRARGTLRRSPERRRKVQKGGTFWGRKDRRFLGTGRLVSSGIKGEAVPLPHTISPSYSQ